MPKLTICGGGNAAHVLIALGAKAGWTVDVFAPLADEAERLRAGVVTGQGITAHFGEQRVTGRPYRVSTDPAEVIPGSELVILALPAFAHGSTLQAIADYLDHGVTIGALSARGGFDFQAQAILDIERLSPRLFGLQTLPWACRITTYGQAVEVLGTKASVDLAAFPAGEAPALADQLSNLLGLPLPPVASFLTLTLSNTGQLIHPGIMCGLGRGKEAATFTADDIPLFYQGVDEHTADLLQAMSDEVQAIASALATVGTFDPQEVHALYDWLLRSYADDVADKSSLRRAFNTNRAYIGLKIPTRPVDADTFVIDYAGRYLSEDVPFGLVVLRGIATLVGTSTPTIDEVITWAQNRLGQQYLVEGAFSGTDLAATRAPQEYGLAVDDLL